MSTTRNILQSEVGFDLTTGKYVLAGIFSGTANYWTGSAWSATFASGNQYTFGTGTQLTAATWTWTIPSAVVPGDTDDGAIQMRGWESGVTPTLADPPTWAVVDVYSPPTQTIVVSAGSTATDSAVSADMTLKLWQHRDYPTSNAQCPAWTIEDYTASTISGVTMVLYPIASYGEGDVSTFTADNNGTATQSGPDTIIKVPWTATETGNLTGSTVNLPTHVYQLYVTVGSTKLHVAEQVCRVVSAA